MQTNQTIFQALREKLAEWSAGAKDRFTEVATQRNDAHHFDEALLMVKGLLFFCIAITLSFGIYFHFNIFKSAGGSTVLAVGASMLLFIVAEILKVIFGRYTLRAIFNGVAFKMPITNLLLTSCFAALTIGAFWWSIDISSKAVSTVNQNINQTNLLEKTPFTPPASIEILDKQIQEAAAASAKAQKSTWRGRPTAEGLAVMQQAEATKQQLIAQRAAEWQAAMTAHQALVSEQGQSITTAALQLGKYGGWSEYVTIFLLLILELLMVACYSRNKAETPETKAETDLMHRQKHSNGHQHSVFSDNKRPIGFQIPIKTNSPNHQYTNTPETKPETKPETLVATALQRVSAPETKPETKVLLQVEIREDIEREVAEQIRNIQRYFAKWPNRGKGGGKPETILANISTFFGTIKELTKHGDISTDLKQKVADNWNRFQTIKNAN